MYKTTTPPDNKTDYSVPSDLQEQLRDALQRAARLEEDKHELITALRISQGERDTLFMEHLAMRARIEFLEDGKHSLFADLERVRSAFGKLIFDLEAGVPLDTLLPPANEAYMK